MMILLFPPPPLYQTFLCVLLHFPSFSPQFSFSSAKKNKKKKRKRRGLEMTFSPNFFSFFLFSRHTSSTTREDGGATNRILQNARRERERERERETKRSTTAEGEKGKRWRTTTNGCLREDVNLETTQKK